MLVPCSTASAASTVYRQQTSTLHSLTCCTTVGPLPVSHTPAEYCSHAYFDIIQLLYRWVPKFWTYGSVCCVCAEVTENIMFFTMGPNLGTPRYFDVSRRGETRLLATVTSRLYTCQCRATQLHAVLSHFHVLPSCCFAWFHFDVVLVWQCAVTACVSWASHAKTSSVPPSAHVSKTVHTT
jgi:hypothetical protein